MKQAERLCKNMIEINTEVENKYYEINSWYNAVNMNNMYKINEVKKK